MTRSLGVCYYPEHWPEAQWQDDAARMVASGLTWVRIGEFAWSRLEPNPGKLEFDWLDRAIDVLGGAGLKVVLGTPTATPPRWMLDRHPDMLAVDADGRPRKFGSRGITASATLAIWQSASASSRCWPNAMVRNPHVAAWQTDNEYGCHDTILSYSDAARVAFRDWLAQRYQSPDALNRAWGNVFWSMEYASFDQVDLPNLTVTEPNPAHVMDFRRFASDQVVAFNRAQVDILRRHSAAPIAHNYMGRETGFDHYDVAADLDIASWDSYPIGFLSDRLEASDDHKAAFLRQGDPDFQAFHHDLYRAVGRGRWWVMEQQPGPVNWAPYNPAPLPGMVRLWTWEAFAHGAETVCYFRWRQAPFGQEQMHAGLLRPDSKPAPGLAEAEAVARELADTPQAQSTPADVALVFDYASAWAWQAQPQGADFDYVRLCFAWYRALRRLGLNIDILPPDTADLSGYKLVLAPGLFSLPDALRAALPSCPGAVVFGPRANSRQPDFSIPPDQGPSLPGLACRVARVESLPPGCTVPLAGGGTFVHWAEDLDTRAEVVLARADGGAAMVRAGAVHYLGGWPDDDTLFHLLRDMCTAQGLDTLDLPPTLRTRTDGTTRFWFNHGAQAMSWRGVDLSACAVLRLPQD